ncbi:MAG: hypothetical protein RR373_08860 [Akkermansia sp.]
MKADYLNMDIDEATEFFRELEHKVTYARQVMEAFSNDERVKLGALHRALELIVCFKKFYAEQEDDERGSL